MAIHHIVRQAQGHAQLAHFVFKQLTQRLKQLQIQGFRQAAYVVVALDGVGFLVFAPADSITSG